MKKYLLWIIAAVAAEIVILLIGTIVGLDRATLMLAVAVLPVMLFIGAIYMILKSFRSSPEKDEEETEDAGE